MQRFCFLSFPARSLHVRCMLLQVFGQALALVLGVGFITLQVCACSAARPTPVYSLSRGACSDGLLRVFRIDRHEALHASAMTMQSSRSNGQSHHLQLLRAC